MSQTREQRIAQSEDAVMRIQAMLHRSPNEWQNYLGLASWITSSLDAINFMSDPNSRSKQLWIVEVLQKHAYSDADSGGSQELAEWCQAQWLKILANHPRNADGLRGAFYLRAVYISSG